MSIVVYIIFISHQARRFSNVLCYVMYIYIYINRLHAVHTSHQIFFLESEQFSGSTHHVVITFNDVPIEMKFK